MSRASEDALANLHSELAKKLTTILKEGETDAEGCLVPAKASTLNVIRQFLKDNEITAPAVPKSPMRDLTDSLPTDFEFED